MKQQTLSILISSLVLSAQAFAAAESHLDPIAWLAGGRWVAETTTPDGKPLLIENQCKWADNGTSLHFNTTFTSNGKVSHVYSGAFAWHPSKQKIVSWYTDNVGDITEGTVTSEDRTLSQELVIYHANGKPENVRSTMVRKSADAYDWAVFLPGEDSKWKAAMNLTYVRQTEAPKKAFVLLLTPSRPTILEDMTPEEGRVFGEHVAYLKGLFEQGKVVFGGPCVDPKHPYGVIIVETASQEEARTILENDPTVKAKINSGTVQPFRIALIEGRKPS